MSYKSDISCTLYIKSGGASALWRTSTSNHQSNLEEYRVGITNPGIEL